MPKTPPFLSFAAQRPPLLLRQRVCVRMPSICTIVTTKVPDVHHCHYTFERSGDTIGTRVCQPQKYRVATCLHSVHPLLSSICGKPHTRVHETPLLLCCYVSPFGTPLALLDLFFCCRRANHVHTSVAPGTDPCLDRLNVSLQALTCVNKAPTSVPGKRQSLLHFGFPVSGFRFRVWGQGFVFQLQVPTNV